METLAPPVIPSEIEQTGNQPKSTPARRRPIFPPSNITILLAISLLLFIAACCLPALEFRNSNKPNNIMYGVEALVIGWTGIFAGVYAWYANPFWFAGIVFGFFRRPTTATIMGVIAIALAATTFAVVGQELPGDEAGVTKTTAIRLLPACYLWMSSVAVLLPTVLFSDAELRSRLPVKRQRH